jgi:hypothetical protein
MNGLMARPVVATLERITSFKGFFISLLIYGVIELALYIIFDSARSCAAGDRSEGWFDRCAYPVNSFRGTYLYIMQVCVTAVYLIAFAYRTYFTGKLIIAGDFDLKWFFLRIYLNVRRVCEYFTMPHTYFLLIAGIVFLAGSVGSKSGETLLLPLVGVSFMEGYDYILKDVIFKGVWGGLGGLELIIAATFLFLVMRAVLMLETLTPLHNYLVERGHVARLHWFPKMRGKI